MFKRIFTALGKFFRYLDTVNRIKATEMLVFELNELENIFTIHLYGSFVGLPAPPAAMAIELLPFMEDELRLMVSRADLAKDATATVMDMLRVD